MDYINTKEGAEYIIMSRNNSNSEENEGQSMKDQIEDAQRSLAKSFQSIFGEQELLAKVIEFFPYPIQIFSIDGTARLINKAGLEMLGIKSVEAHVGKYNVFEDPTIHQFVNQIRQVLTGKTVYLTDVSASYRDLIRYFDVEDRDIQTISANVTNFPLINADGVIEYFASVFIFVKLYQGREEIGWARQYIETHWQEPFDLSETAKAACLSKAHFTKLFRKHTGLTPHEYYINYKISILKEKLLDANLSIAQAFAACSMDYNGNSARLFREKVGVSPSVYRKILE